jgi:hypothetical protein
VRILYVDKTKTKAIVGRSGSIRRSVPIASPGSIHVCGADTANETISRTC